MYGGAAGLEICGMVGAYFTSLDMGASLVRIAAMKFVMSPFKAVRALGEGIASLRVVTGGAASTTVTFTMSGYRVAVIIHMKGIEGFSFIQELIADGV
jgi:hypothetical protein